jgi:hypothetical protein
MECGGGKVSGHGSDWELEAERLTKYFHAIRKLFAGQPRLYRQDHSRGRGLTTTGQPTVSLLPLNT